MEKEMLALAKFKEGYDKFPKFMEWMQSDEGLAERSNLPFRPKLKEQLCWIKAQ